jgi:putative phosphonate metabolism protein
MATRAGRYAIYYAPAPETALADFGRSWLGYDAETGRTVEQPTMAGIPAPRLAEITAEPRRYGLHATLKPPFSLAADRDAAELAAALAVFAAQRPPILAPPLMLAAISGFWALVPSQPCPALMRLAAACVRDFDFFRTPPSEGELARRRRAGLSPTQESLLARWGYPYVMDEFRFHLTLTGRLAPDEAPRVGASLAEGVAPLCRAALPVDAIALFHQPGSGENFRLIGRYRLSGTGEAAIG